MSVGHVVTIRRVGDCTYAVDIADTAEMLRAYEFQVLTDRIPTVVWSDAFGAEVGTLTGPGQEILSVVLAFHRLTQSDIHMSPDCLR